MFQSQWKIAAVALGGLAVAGFGAVALGNWFWTQEADVHVQAPVSSPPDTPGPEPGPARTEDDAVKKHVGPRQMLEAALSRMHQQAVNRFINSNGLGKARIPAAFPTLVLKEWKIPWWSPGELDKETPVAGKKDLESIHQDSLRHFSSGKPGNIAAKGYWEIKSLDLLGVVKHASPVVYVSEKLPDMEDLKETPTRPLDFFEFAGLESLQKGANLYTRSKDGTIRMLGAVRATGQCLACHDTSKEGDLLGAFSYTLRVAEYSRHFGNGQVQQPAVPPAVQAEEP